MKTTPYLMLLVVPFLLLELAACASQASGEPSLTIQQATLMEADQPTTEISTDELQTILAEQSAKVFDARSSKEYAISHIPGALNVAMKPGASPDAYVSDAAEVGRLVQNNKAAPIVLYCSGPFCGKSKRLAAELIDAGYNNVRRYQLGIPTWRALVGLTQIESEGLEYVSQHDQTAVWIDARDPEESSADPVHNAQNVPLNDVKVAKSDGRLPMDDHNTRVIVFGGKEGEAEAVGEALAQNAFHNVSFFAGLLEEIQAVSGTGRMLLQEDISSAGSEQTIYQTTLMEPDQPASEVSTEELQTILRDKTAAVFDARPSLEYAISHVPGALNVAAKPGVPMDLNVSDVAEVGRLVNNDKAAPIVVYCSGPFCSKSKRLSEELLDAGYTNVRRYQLGVPTWRALVGLMQIEPKGIEYVWGKDQTAVWIDARDPEESSADPIPNARNIPLDEVKAAKKDERLPMNDHNTRIIVFGKDGAQAQAVGESIAHNAFHNVTFFAGTLEEFRTATSAGQ